MAQAAVKPPAGFVLDGDTPNLPPGFVVDSAPVEKPPTASAPTSWLDTLKSYLPSRRTALQTTGAMVGGTLGAPAGGPFGAVAGGALGAGAGDAVDQLISRWRGEKESPQTSSDAASRIANAGTLGAVQEGVGAAIPALARGTARGLYRNALKPSTTMAADEANGLVNTGLRERIPVSEKGVGKLNRTISGINDQIDTTIAGKPNGTVSPVAVARRIDPAVNDFQYKDLQGDARAASGERQRFLTEHSTPAVPGTQPTSQLDPVTGITTTTPGTPGTPSAEIPIPNLRAQAMKKAIWQELAPNDFGTVAEGYKQARKLTGTGIKEELQTQFPNLQGLNAREGNLLELRDPLNRAVNRIANRNTVGIDAPLTAGAMQAVTGSEPLSIAAALAKTLPGSRTAIALNRMAPAGRFIPGASRLIAPVIKRSLAGNQ